jgi:hypothetical protein
MGSAPNGEHGLIAKSMTTRRAGLLIDASRRNPYEAFESQGEYWRRIGTDVWLLPAFIEQIPYNCQHEE